MESTLASLSDATASHCCWAWRYQQHYRSADAGEPSGSAGRPILAAINGQEIDHVLVVVMRWFGGVKLGIGGLVRAYGGTAAECLRQAPKIALIEYARAELRCGFEFADAVHRLLNHCEVQILQSNYGQEGLLLTLDVPRSSLQKIEHDLADTTRGRAWFAVTPVTSE